MESEELARNLLSRARQGGSLAGSRRQRNVWGGRADSMITRILSARRTCTLQGKNEQGRKVHDVVVFERQ
jgi:hypothetical protein